MNSQKRLVSLLVVLFLMGYATSKYWVDLAVDRRRDKYDIRMLPSPKTARFIALGFEPVLADVYWIEGLNYFGGELVNKNRTYQYLDSYVDLIQSLDPYFTTFYEWASTVFIYNALPITRDNVRKAIKYANAGINNLDKIHRYSAQMIIKNAFNFGLEIHDHKRAVDYFEFAGRSFVDQRDMLLVGSSYALYGKDPARALAMRLEYLGHIGFEAQQKDQIIYALRVLSSNKTHERTGEFMRALRLKMETEDDIRKIVEARLNDSPMLQRIALAPQEFTSDKRIDNILNIDFSRTWMPADLLALVSI
jgi:hypothetical protein